MASTFLLGSAPAFLLGQDAKTVEPFKAYMYLGANQCKQCHTLPTPDRAGGEAGNRPIDWCLFTEFTTWRTLDKHSLAYAVLEGPRGAEIGRRLGEIEVSKEAACLSCHAMNYPVRGSDYNAKDGVNCEVCHGPSGGVPNPSSPGLPGGGNWLTPHAQVNWRNLSPTEKQGLGMRNLRDPLVKAELCLSCHVGDASEGRVVSHAMYAAGHPPLPSINISAYSRNEPQHWRSMGEVPYWRTEAAAPARTGVGYSEDKLFESESAVVGNVVSIRSFARLLAARSDLKDDVPGRFAAGYWPELTLNAELRSRGAMAVDSARTYWPEMAMTHSECYACHHELQLPSWRQLRGYVGTPGRPLPQAWPTALIEVALDQFGTPEDRSDFDATLTALLDAFDRRPFGDPAEVHERAGAMADWSQGFLESKLMVANFDSATSFDFARRLTEHALGANPDYETARQIASTLAVISRELVRTGRFAPADPGTLDALLSEWDAALNLGRYPFSEERDELSKTVIESLAGKELSGFPDWTPFAQRYSTDSDSYFQAAQGNAFLQAMLLGVPTAKLRDAYVSGDFRTELQAINNRGIAEALTRIGQFDPEAFRAGAARLRDILDKGKLVE